MNCTEAKKTVFIVDYLNKMGLKPDKINNYEYWYKSPIRQENEASFKVNTSQNVWYDFGLGSGGNIIDLVIALHNCSVAEALTFLGNKDIKMTLPKDYYSVKKDIVTDFLAKDLTDYNLIKYLKERAIDPLVAKKYLKELRYKVKGKEYYSIGIKNDSEGYEARNKYIKINLFGKDITTITGNNKDVNVFEGFFDFISYLIINKDSINDNHIIMNGLSQLNKTMDTIRNSNYHDIYLFLDNDNSGKLAFKRVKAVINKVKDGSFFYSNHKDINDFLLVKEKKN